MKKKILKIIGIISIIIVVLSVSLVAYTFYRIETGQLVQWEGKWYTQEELKEKYPPQEYEVEAKNTPEEVYTKFREAVLNNNEEEALEYIEKDEKQDSLHGPGARASISVAESLEGKPRALRSRTRRLGNEKLRCFPRQSRIALGYEKRVDAHRQCYSVRTHRGGATIECARTRLSGRRNGRNHNFPRATRKRGSVLLHRR